MDIEKGQTILVSNFNRLRAGKPYLKAFVVVDITKTHIVASPVNYADTPKMWMRFGRKNLRCRSQHSAYEYCIWESEQAFNRAVLEGVV